MPTCYFAYGSNMNLARMRARGMAFSALRPALLPGYRLTFNKQCHRRPTVAYANIVPASGSVVEGVVYYLESASTLEKMDYFEGTPVRYSREQLWLHCGEARLAAWVYVANPAFINNALLPESNYLAHLLAGAEHLSADYLARLQSQPCLPSVGIEGEEGLRFNV